MKTARTLAGRFLFSYSEGGGAVADINSRESAWLALRLKIRRKHKSLK